MDKYIDSRGMRARLGIGQHRNVLTQISAIRAMGVVVFKDISSHIVESSYTRHGKEELVYDITRKGYIFLLENWSRRSTTVSRKIIEELRKVRNGK